jgi:hypothetical protein
MMIICLNQWDQGSRGPGCFRTLGAVEYTTWLTKRRAVDNCRMRSSLCRTH